MTKKKCVILVFAILLAIAVLLVAFWDSIVINLFPKTVLTEALHGAMDDLSARFERSPISVLADYVDPAGQYTARMELETENSLLGPVRYDMTVSADTEDNRFAAEGVVYAGDNDLDMSVYLDREFMALSSRGILGGAYYGITYDTFPEDIRSIPLLSMFIGESVLSGWESSVSDIRAALNRSYQLPDIPQITTDQIRQAMLAVMLLPSQVERVEIPVWGVYDQAYRISYRAEGESVREVLGYLMDTGNASDASVHAAFYVYDGQLVMMQLTGEAGENSIQCAIEFMLDSATTRTFRFSRIQQGTEEGFCLRHKAQSANGYLDESWSLYPNFGAEGECTELSYRWEPVMGELVVYAQPSITLNVFETEAGLHIQTGDFAWILDAITGNEPDLEEAEISCNLILSKSAQFTTPTYKNISQWSLEDLLVLLGGVGSLLGLDI